MLTVSKMQNIKYYTTLAAEDYYVGRKCSLEPQGKWMGKGAEKLGLDVNYGIIKDEEFRNLFHGFSPNGKEKFVYNAGLYNGTKRDRMPGYDLTFGAPKSVSICWAIGDQETRKEIEQAHQKAIERTIQEIEKQTIIRTGKGGKIKESCGLIVGVFQHATARQVDKETLPDMHLHSHATVINTGIGVRGGKAAVNGADFLNAEFAKRYGAFYRAELASGLVRLGFELERTKDAFEIKGVSQGLLNEFSKRSEQIEKQIDREKATAKEKLRANKATRQKKREYEAVEITSYWEKTAAQKHHFTKESVEKLRGRFHQEEQKRERELEAEKKEKERTKEEREIKTVGLDPANVCLKAVRQAAEELNEERQGFTKKELTERAMQVCTAHGITYEQMKEGVNHYVRTEALKIGEKQTPYEKKTEQGTEQKIFKELIYVAPTTAETAKKIAQERDRIEAQRLANFVGAVKKFEGEGKKVIIAAWSNKKAEDLEGKTGCKTTTIQKLFGDDRTTKRAAEKIREEQKEKGTTIRRIKANLMHATWQWSGAERDRYTGDNLNSKWLADFRYATYQISKDERDYIHRQIDILDKENARQARAIDENTVVIFESLKSPQNKTLQATVEYVQSQGGEVIYANDLKGQGRSFIDAVHAAAAKSDPERYAKAQALAPAQERIQQK